MALAIDIRAEAVDTVAISVRGEIEPGDAARIDEAVRGAIARYRPPVLCLDLGLVTFMAAEAARALGHTNLAAQSSGAWMVIRNPGPHVRRMLDLFGTGIPVV